MDPLQGVFNFLGSAISSVAEEIMAIGIIAGLGYLARRRIPRHWREILSETFKWRRRAGGRGLDYSGLRAQALAALREDQSIDGAHYGQFGKSADLENEEKYQSGAEDVAHKPRMYLTSWPAIVLKKRNHLKSNVALAVRGVEAMMVRGSVRVAQTSGEVSPTKRRFLISYRHTISACLMLVLIRGWSHKETAVLGEMLDPSGHWQNKDGGWAQCDKVHTKSDLWASAYAARFLHAAVNSQDLSGDQVRASAAALERTVTFFATSWRQHRWKYKDMTLEEVVTDMLIEVGAVLHALDQDLLREVLGHVNQWIGLGGGLTHSLVRKCEGVSQFALQARMAYALHQARRPRQEWLPVFDHVLRHRHEHANAAELAFMLDMTYLATE
jgi:hypothetical protein